MRLELFQRLCSDNVKLGERVAAQVLMPRPMSAARTTSPGGIFAELAVRGVDLPQGTFHFEVLRLTALSHSMPLRAPATSLASDVERLDGRICIPARATLAAAIEDDIARFENAGRRAAMAEATGVR